MTDTFITMREYEAIVWAYARLQFEVENNLIPEQSVKAAEYVIDIIDKFTERVKKQVESEDN
jgi:hypothetical protein